MVQHFCRMIKAGSAEGLGVSSWLLDYAGGYWGLVGNQIIS